MNDEDVVKVLNVAGARPNFMKIGPIHAALSEDDRFQSRIVHTGQHYDDEMSAVFFRELELPEPDAHLGVGSGSHAEQTAAVMTAFERVLVKEDPDVVLVVGDVNSTLAAALVASKLHVPVGHVEAGLRSFDERMPEEINRKLTDQLSEWLFVTEQSGADNLRQEGIREDRIHFVGNVMIDSLIQCREKARRRPILQNLGLEGTEYVVMTMHRPSNVDDPDKLYRMVQTIELLTADTTVVFPMHPRTRERLKAGGELEEMDSMENLKILEPLGYLDFLRLMEEAGLVLTDSGGIQEETTFLGVPCLTVRDNTERPVTVEIGTNRLVDFDPERIVDQSRRSIAARPVGSEVPPLWDGDAAIRIVNVLKRKLVD